MKGDGYVNLVNFAVKHSIGWYRAPVSALPEWAEIVVFYQSSWNFIAGQFYSIIDYLFDIYWFLLIFLRVAAATIQKWEGGLIRLPFH
jgi:hypothetical protein